MMGNKLLTAKEFWELKSSPEQIMIEYADLFHKDRLGALLKFIEDKMELFPEDMNLSERGAYDAYLNIRELVKAQIGNY